MATTLDVFVSRLDRVSESPSQLSVVPAPHPNHQSDFRFAQLQDACALLADGFPQLNQLIEDYVLAVPLQHRSILRDDAAGFLKWISRGISLDDEQRDLVMCLKSRHAVEFVALKQRLAFARFQERAAATSGLLADKSRWRQSKIHMNPVHVWARFETRIMLDVSTRIPATVLFYPVGREIRTVVIEADAEPLLRTLERGPLSVRSVLAGLEGEELCEMQDILIDLAQLNIIAFS
jgi:hypothetical protein